jgi:membrane associated rhomboid family serine protease
MKNADAFKKAALYLSLGFVIWRVWDDPTGSADTAGNFFGAIGGVVSSAIDKGSAFLKGLVN